MFQKRQKKAPFKSLIISASVNSEFWSVRRTKLVDRENISTFIVLFELDNLWLTTVLKFTAKMFAIS